jgi:hypothetical protein
VLLAFGYSPVVANVSNTVGLVPGSVTGTHGYRAELQGQGRRAAVLAVASVAGALTGGTLLLALPGSAFKAIVPFFIGLALVLVLAQPWLSTRLAARYTPTASGGATLFLSLFGIGIYGGYFGAAQGILLLAALGLGLREGLQRVNALKNVLAGMTNLAAACLFVLAAHVDWRVALVLAAGSSAGGLLGARVGRKLSPDVLRVLIVAIGIAAIVKLTV